MKEMIRKQYKLMRSSMSKEEVMQKSRAAAMNFLESDYYKKSEQIMLYMPLGNETDTALIIQSAFRDQKTVLLPVTDEKNGQITPVVVSRDTEFTTGAFSVLEPIETKVGDMKKTDVILVPGIAFDQRGSRIGFGKGCYDRFSKNLSSLMIGFCYHFQICEKIPSENHDVKMNLLVTEKGLFRCENTIL